MSTIPVLFVMLVIFILLFSAMFIVAYANQFKLLSYLKKTKYSRWAELTSIGKSSPGYANPVRFWKYLKSDLDVADETILKYKHKIIIFLRYSFWILLGIGIHCIMLAFFILKFSV
jgi:hypothetical protein